MTRDLIIVGQCTPELVEKMPRNTMLLEQGFPPAFYYAPKVDLASWSMMKVRHDASPVDKLEADEAIMHLSSIYPVECLRAEPWSIRVE